MKKYAGKIISVLLAAVMIFTVFPVIAAPAADSEAVRIIRSEFRAHPKTSSIFDGDVPNNLLWTEFSNRVDHAADYDKSSKTYLLDGKYYQLVIERPAHGPGNDHQATTIIPDNGIAGSVSDIYSEGEENTKHRYHGWQVGTNELFEQDTDVEHQVGDYTVKLMRLNPTDSEISAGGETLMNCENRYEVNSSALRILEITYRLSEDDKQKGYKLKCPMEDNPQDTITELAMEGDWISIISPSLDSSSAAEETKQTISYWRIVNSDGQPGENAGNVIPAASKDGTDDNKITLEAVLQEPKTYTYEFQKNDDSGTSVVPTKEPDAAPGTTAPPASYNMIVSGTDEPEKIEYDPSGEIKPLELRLVNTGNQPIYVTVFSQNDNFDVLKINQNTGPEAQKPQYEGGLSAGERIFWYIPSARDVENQKNEKWVNYAIVRITPKKGLTPGTHMGMISSMENAGSRIMKSFNMEIKVDKKEVRIAPHNVTKEYGKTLTPADILCDVYDGAGNELEHDLTAAELGTDLVSEGISGDAKVNGGEPYPFTGISDGLSDGGNYNVTLKDGLNTGITVTKTTPVISSAVTATGINDNSPLSASMLSGTYVNKNSQQAVEGSLKWLEPDKTINLGQSGTVNETYQFTPSDLDNYNIPPQGTAEVVVSSKKATNLRLTNTTKTYNGSVQTPGFAWDRGGAVQTEYLKVVYKKADQNDTTFSENENFDEYTDTPKEAGTYKVHATYPESTYYAEGVANGIFTINPYTLGVNPRNALDKVYDGTNIATADSSKIVYTKPKTDDDVSIVPGALMGTFVSSNASGDGYVHNVALNALTKEQYAAAYPGAEIPDTYPLIGKDAANYKLSNETIRSLGKITRRPLKLALKEDIHKGYGETIAFTASDCVEAADQQTPGGLAEGDTIEELKFELYADSNANESAATVGEYDVRVRIPSGVFNHNYNLDTSNVLGKIIVDKATPEMISINSDGGIEGQTLRELVDEHFTGTFENPYTNARIEGTLEWVDPEETLSKSKSEYEWKFTPSDLDNYNILTGFMTVAVGDKPVAPITEFDVPSEITYDGEAHPVTIKSSVEAALTTVEYRKLDIQPHGLDALAEEEPWTYTPPVDAGTYEVRGTIHAYGGYAENSITKTMTILQAEPKGSVTASPVNRGDKLVSSQLTYDFKGVKDETLSGAVTWNNVGVAAPSMITIEAEDSYYWTFIPESTNYKSVVDTAIVGVIPNTRAPEVEVYNIPASVVGGDYAYVTVDGENLKIGDTVTFYLDEDMTNPISSDFVITEDMSGKVKVMLDNELDIGGGTIYVNIKYSDTVKAAVYKPQVGFAIVPDTISVKAGESAEARLVPSDESYVIESADWTPERAYIAQVEPSDGGKSATITGIDEGGTRIDVTASFKHPDSSVSENITVSNSAAVTVEATPEPTETPAPATATPEVTETPAPATATPEVTEIPAPATATPEVTETPAPATATPEITETPAPATATPEVTETPTPAHEEVYFITPPSLSGKSISAEIGNISGNDAWFIAAAYRNGAMIDFKIVPVPAGTTPVSAEFREDYAADSTVSVRFFLWDAATLKPYSTPVLGK